MRFAYVDEAGTSRDEPVSIVAAIVVDADKHWRKLESNLQDIKRKYLSDSQAKQAVFHATEIYSGGKSFKREEWSFETRFNILQDLIGSFQTCNMTLCFGYCFKNHIFRSNPKDELKIRHLTAYLNCLEGIDRFLDGQGEIATVIAEDVPKIKKSIKDVHKLAKGMTLPHYAAEESALPRKIQHVIDTPHFVEKGDAPLLEYADVFAFSIRRYLAGLKHGKELVEMFLDVNDPEFKPKDGASYFVGTTEGIPKDNQNPFRPIYSRPYR